MWFCVAMKLSIKTATFEFLPVTCNRQSKKQIKKYAQQKVKKICEETDQSGKKENINGTSEKDIAASWEQTCGCLFICYLAACYSSAHMAGQPQKKK